MKLDQIPAFFKQVDDKMDMVPVVSIVNNLIDLIQKIVVLPRMEKDTIDKNYYLSHLEDKSIIRCVLLMIPILGNVSVPLYDMAKSHFVRKTIDHLPPDYNTSNYSPETYNYIKSLSFAVRDDPKIMKAAIQKDWNCLALASPHLQKDREFLLSVLPADGSYSLQHVDDELKSDLYFMLQTRQYSEADSSLWQDRVFALEAFKANPGYLIGTISDTLLEDNEFNLGLLKTVLGKVNKSSIDAEFALASVSPLKRRMADPDLKEEERQIFRDNVRQIFLDKIKEDTKTMDFLLQFDQTMIDDDFVLDALRANGKILGNHQFTKRCAKKEFLLKAIEIEPGAFFNIPSELSNDLVFRKEAKALFDQHGPRGIGG